jgi:hypothetical protein
MRQPSATRQDARKLLQAVDARADCGDGLWWTPSSRSRTAACSAAAVSPTTPRATIPPGLNTLLADARGSLQRLDAVLKVAHGSPATSARRPKDLGSPARRRQA